MTSANEDQAALTVTCPNCAAPPGEPCTAWTAGGSGDDVGIVPRQRGPHPERYAELIDHNEVNGAATSPMTTREIRATLTGIRNSLHLCPATGPACRNIERRIEALEERLG